MSHIVVVTPYFWPEVAASVPLMTSLVEDLVGRGHRVTVLTSTPSPAAARAAAESGAMERWSGRGEYRGADVIRVRNPFARRRGLAAKLAEYAFFCVWALARLLRLRGADVIFVSSNPPLFGLPVAWIGRWVRARVVYNLQDIFPESAVASGLLPNRGWIVDLCRRMERATYGAVDHVIAISEEFAEHVVRLTARADLTVIPNWIDTDSIRPVAPEENRFLAATGLRDRFIVLYAGNLGYLQRLDTVLDAAAMLRDLPDFAFVFVGQGQTRAAIEERARREGLDQCHFFDYQPHEWIADVYSAGAIGIVPMRRGAGRSSVPSKTWTIMACARPVVTAIEADSALADAVRTSDAGLVVAPEDARALAEAIRKLHADEALRERLGANGRAYVEAHLARPTITARYEVALAEARRA